MSCQWTIHELTYPCPPTPPPLPFQIVPVSLLQGFDAHELEFLTAGTLEIDVDDWRTNTEYRNGEEEGRRKGGYRRNVELLRYTLLGWLCGTDSFIE